MFFFNDTATTEIYTRSLHDALPISGCLGVERSEHALERDLAVAALHQLGHLAPVDRVGELQPEPADRKSTRLNSSHANISYAVFCLKKKKTIIIDQHFITSIPSLHR